MSGDLLRLIENDTRRRKSNVTGFCTSAAVAELVRTGMPQQDAELAVRQAVLDHFPAFANSWDGYIDRNGYLLELLLLPGDQKAHLAGNPAWAGLNELVQRAADSRMSMLSDTALVVELAKLSELNSRRDETHPAYALMVNVHGLHPELARAVMLHAKVIPWWAYPLLGFLILLGAGTFLLALVNPHSAVFENESVGGVGWMHYILLPLVTLALIGALWLIVKRRPLLEREWRQQLERYRRASATGPG